MEKYILQNGVRVIYEYRKGNITSFCVGVNAGALEEYGYNAGIAHAVEHMVFKGTRSRTEFQINKCFDEVFGFNNAMTNYPYAIYYGTVNSEEFERGFELYTDILLNPSFPADGFSEEISVIHEELKEWKEDVQQFTEDTMLANAFDVRRIKDLIIGSEESLKKITLEEIRQFYKSFYVPQNCVVSAVTSLDKKDLEQIVYRYLGEWNSEFSGIKKEIYEDNKPGIFYNNFSGCSGAKVLFCYPIHSLSDDEVESLQIFNMIFGEGTSSLLYDEIRTRRGLAYEVGSTVKNERGIKLFTIYVGTSADNAEIVVNLIKEIVGRVKNVPEIFSCELIKSAVKRMKLKRELAMEKSIELTKRLTTYELMYGALDKVFDEITFSDRINGEDIQRLVNKVLSNPTIQVIK